MIRGRSGYHGWSLAGTVPIDNIEPVLSHGPPRSRAFPRGLRCQQTEFTKFFGRPENSEKRDISLGDFSGRDCTPFSLRVIKPKSIRIKATGLNGKAYDFEIPWK
jgi:hypothetical protein